jgi:hypothetical protein
MGELTDTGYKLKTQNQWFEEERALYLEIDPQWNLDPSTPDGLKIAHDAEIFSLNDETLMQAYNSKDPNKATKYDLDVVCSLTGTKRSKGSGSSVELVLTGVNDTSVPEGTRIDSSTTGSRWMTDQRAVIVDGSVTVQATCTVVGPTQADIGTITKIVDVTGGLTGATNPAPATIGTSRQLDDSLRVMRAYAVGRPGSNQTDSLYGEIFSVAGVRRVKVYVNSTNSAAVSDENPHGLPARSTAVIVDGGAVPDIAMAIYLKIMPSAPQYQPGTPVTYEVQSPKYPAQKKIIKYSTPSYVDMIVVLTVKNDGTLPEDADIMIKEAFLEFVSGELVPAGVGFKIEGFDIGESVPYSTMFTPINKVIGEYGNSFVQSMTLNGAESSVPIAFNQLSRWTTANIQVTIV